MVKSTVKDYIEDDAPMRIPFYPDNLKELIENEILTENDTNRSVHNSLCDTLDIARHIFSKTATMKKVKEEYGIGAVDMAKAIIKNPKLAEQIKKELGE